MLYDPKLTQEIERIEPHFDADALAAICALPEEEFGTVFGMQRWNITNRTDDNFFFFRDNGSNVLAVAHLDTVADAATRRARFVETEAGLVVFSRALDDRLGAYIILDLLPRLGVNVDILLTTGEESGRSTAEFYEPSDSGKEHNWMIEFDRGGKDVVMYQYEDRESKQLVRDCGATVGDGSFSDIAYLEHLEIKGFNWGTGYRDYHGPRSHAFIDDTLTMVAYFLRFFEVNEDEYLPHEKVTTFGRYGRSYGGGYGRSGWGGGSGGGYFSGKGGSALDDPDDEWEAYYRSFGAGGEDVPPADLDLGKPDATETVDAEVVELPSS